MTEAASVDEGRLVAGRYRLVERIGQGGMGTVWRARDEVLGRQVAVKRLHVSPQLEPDELATRHERTTREAQAAARINHPNVVGVHDVVDDAGSPCIVMEYVPSSTLGDAIKDAVREHRSVTPREAARIGRGMIAALRAAHEAGVLHRDVKPGNVLLGRDGRVVLTDFGIAVASGTSTLTKTGELVGSIDYLAPERVKGGTPGPASDLWALGATLYQAVEGKPPFRKNTAVETAYSIAIDPVEPPRNAGPLTPLIEALLAKEPEARPTAEVVEQALRAAEKNADTARMGWPTLALGTVGGPKAPDGSSEAPTRPVASTGGLAATTDTGSGSGTVSDTGPGHGTGSSSGTGPGSGTGPNSVAGSGSGPHPGAGFGPHAGFGPPTGFGPSTGFAPTPGTGTGTTTGGGTGPGAVTGRVPLADGAGSQTSTGDRTDVLTTGAPPRKRRGRVVIWSVVGLLAVGGGGGAAWYVMHRESGSVPSGAGPADHGTPTPSIGPPPPVPEGFHQVKEKGIGVSFPVPDGWKREVKDGGRQILYTNNAELAQLTVNALDFSSDDQVQHFKEVETDLRKIYPVYKRLRLQDTTYQGDPAAIWEFTFQGKAREYRGIDLGFGREGAKEYAIYVSAPSAGWAKFEQYFTHIKDGFRRTDPAA